MSFTLLQHFHVLRDEPVSDIDEDSKADNIITKQTTAVQQLKCRYQENNSEIISKQNLGKLLKHIIFLLAIGKHQEYQICKSC